MWSRRAQEYEQKINSGKLYQLAEVVKDLNKKTDVIAEQSYSERQLFEKAYERLKSEFEVVLGEKAQKKMDKALGRNEILIKEDFSLIESAKDLARSYPDLIVIPISADYTRPLTLPVLPSELVRVGFFPGSTIGNFSRDEAIKFLRTASIYLGAGNGLLIGVDLKKDTDMLFAAYDDAAGVTARFNLNILNATSEADKVFIYLHATAKNLDMHAVHMFTVKAVSYTHLTLPTILLV